MAQFDKEETTELKVPGAPLCANNCGLPGNPATKNMCQSCFKASVDLISSSSAASIASFKARSEAVRAEAAGAGSREGGEEVRRREDDESAEVAVVKEKKEEAAAANRCGGCRRKVGLTAFRCRCGGLFCAEHRYSDRHGCGYDYKAAGRERIARENPVHKAAKIVRI